MVVASPATRRLSADEEDRGGDTGIYSMWFTYVLRSLKTGRMYVGFTSDLKQRLRDHNKRIGGHYSSRNSPFELIFYEAYRDKRDAQSAERYFKSGHGREILKDKLKYSLRGQ